MTLPLEWNSKRDMFDLLSPNRKADANLFWKSTTMLIRLFLIQLFNGHLIETRYLEYLQRY